MDGEDMSSRKCQNTRALILDKSLTSWVPP